jgi:hypothetical protein
MKRLVVAGALTAAALAVPAAAQADVLVNAVPSRLVCGDVIQVGVFAQFETRGNRAVRITAIDRSTGTAFWHRTAGAPIGRWRFWTLPSGRNGQCGPTTIVYRGHRPDGSAWTARYRVRFRGGGL